MDTILPLMVKAVSVILVRNQDISRMLHYSLGRNLPLERYKQDRMVKVKGPTGIETEYHFLPWSFEPCRGAHFSHRLPLSPSTAQGRSRTIDRDGDEKRDAHHRSQQDKTEHALMLSGSQPIPSLLGRVGVRGKRPSEVGEHSLLETPLLHTHPSPPSEPLL